MHGNWKIAIIVCVISLGGLVEFLKSTNRRRPEHLLTAQELKTLELQPYNRKAGEIATITNQKRIKHFKKLRQQIQQNRKNTQSVKLPQNHSFNQHVLKTPPASKTLEKTKKSEKKLAKSKQISQKQKKTSKKSKENSIKRAKKTLSTKKATDTYTRKTTELIPTTAPVEAAEEKGDIPGMEEWLRRILTHPSLEETTHLIKYYQSNLITAEMFYSIVEQMLEDSRERMRSLGIKAASSAPSYRSFTLLARLVQMEPFGSDVRSEGNQSLERYTQLAYLNVIEIVMYSQENPATRKKALNLLVDSARKNLATAAINPLPNPVKQGQETNPVQQRYSDILITLEQMLGTDAGQEYVTLFTALQNAIDRLKSLLNA